MKKDLGHHIAYVIIKNYLPQIISEITHDYTTPLPYEFGIKLLELRENMALVRTNKKIKNEKDKDEFLEGLKIMISDFTMSLKTKTNLEYRN